MVFLEAEKMAVTWTRRLEQAAKWEQEVKSQSKFEEEHW